MKVWRIQFAISIQSVVRIVINFINCEEIYHKNFERMVQLIILNTLAALQKAIEHKTLKEFEVMWW